MITAKPNSGQPANSAMETFPPQPVSCRWLSKSDEARAQHAAIIRLIVDDQRGYLEPWPNEVYNRSLVREVKEFVGPVGALVVTPAGTITTTMPDSNDTRSCLARIQQCLSTLDLGPSAPGVLLGIDACIPQQATPLQTVVHLADGRPVSLEGTAIKLYPASPEKTTLIGWLACQRAGEVPADLFQGHVVETQVGKVLVLVCHEAVLFSGRSIANLQDDIGIELREWFGSILAGPEKPRFVMIATHWQDIKPQTGLAFIDAISALVAQFGVSVVTTMRTPRIALQHAAARYAVQGPESLAVATLLVEDTLAS